MTEPRGLQEEQIKKAVTALLRHIEKQKGGSKDLFEEDELLYLVSVSDIVAALTRRGGTGTVSKLLDELTII
jgi:hypothetical protein